MEVVEEARGAYYKAHQPNFEQEGSYDLSSSFWQMATSTNLLGTKIHEVQENWGAGRISELPTELPSPPQKTSISLRVVMPTKLPKLMGLKGIHSPEAL